MNWSQNLCICYYTCSCCCCHCYFLFKPRACEGGCQGASRPRDRGFFASGGAPVLKPYSQTKQTKPNQPNQANQTSQIKQPNQTNQTKLCRGLGHYWQGFCFSFSHGRDKTRKLCHSRMASIRMASIHIKVCENHKLWMSPSH